MKRALLAAALLAGCASKPPAPDRELERTLLEEAPGILRWAINGCLDWQAHGLVRQEPKDYVIRDGDILNIRFSV